MLWFGGGGGVMHRSTCSVIKDQIKLIFDSAPSGNVYQGQHRNKKVLSEKNRDGAQGEVGGVSLG